MPEPDDSLKWWQVILLVPVGIYRYIRAFFKGDPDNTENR